MNLGMFLETSQKLLGKFEKESWNKVGRILEYSWKLPKESQMILGSFKKILSIFHSLSLRTLGKTINRDLRG